MFPMKTGDFSWDFAKQIMIWWTSSGNDHELQAVWGNKNIQVHFLLSINPYKPQSYWTKPTEHTLSGFLITIHVSFKPWWPIDLGIILQFDWTVRDGPARAAMCRAVLPRLHFNSRSASEPVWCLGPLGINPEEFTIFSTFNWWSFTWLGELIEVYLSTLIKELI